MDTTASSTLQGSSTGFGSSVDMTDSFAIVADSTEKKAFIFARDTSTGIWDTTAVASITGYIGVEGFGNTVAMTDSFAIVGAVTDKKAFVFARDTSTGIWDTTAVASITGYTGETNFGFNVDITDDYAIIGALFAGGDYKGKAYIFARDKSTGVWDTTAVTSLIRDVSNSGFGHAVAITDNYALVGAHLENKAYIFVRDTSTGLWDTTAIATMSGTGYFGGGCALSQTEDYAIVGAHSANEAFIFARDTSTGIWDTTAVASITGYNSDTDFGKNVAITDEYVVVGTRIAGTAYVFERDYSSGTWATTAVTNLHTSYSGETNFGRGVALSTNFAIVSTSGKAFIFEAMRPSSSPTSQPSSQPSSLPSSQPSVTPSAQPYRKAPSEEQGESSILSLFTSVGYIVVCTVMSAVCVIIAWLLYRSRSKVQQQVGDDVNTTGERHVSNTIQHFHNKILPHNG
jgi:hypothetical protein